MFNKKYFLLIYFLCPSFLSCSEVPKVALLFLTRSDFNQIEIWKNWIDPTLYTTYIHSKFSVSDPNFTQYEIPEKEYTDWGYLLLAQQALLKEALKNPLNSKFVFLSESCVPLKPTLEVYNILTSEPLSHMHWKEIWWAVCPDRILVEFPLNHHFGNHQWIILNRKHAQMIADDDDWIHKAMQHVACDEAYPATFFSMQGVLHEFKNEVTTYVDWERGEPYLFSDNIEENFKHLVHIQRHPIHPVGTYGYLFARKFSKDFPSAIIQSFIDSIDVSHLLERRDL